MTVSSPDKMVARETVPDMQDAVGSRSPIEEDVVGPSYPNSEVDTQIALSLSQIREPSGHDDLVGRCLKAVQLLEETTHCPCADPRIELAWHVANTLLYDSRYADVCTRALLAAYPPQSTVKDRLWERRWLTAIAVAERIRGNITQSLRAEAAALDLAQEIGDTIGQASALANLAAHALLSARFDEALQLSEFAIATATYSSNLGALANAFVVRSNTLLYLGRYQEALEEAYKALSAVGPVAQLPDKRRVVLAKALVAESLISLGRIEEAGVPVASVEDWAGESGAWALVREGRRVRALLEVANGEVERGLSTLRNLREEVAMEAPSLLMDLLQSEYRARSMAGDHDGALEVLRELRSYFVTQAEQTLRGLTEAPALGRYFQPDRRLAEIDRYVESKRLLTRIVAPADSSWDYLVALAASSVSPEDSTLEHGIRVGRLAAAVAELFGLGAQFEAALAAAGLVHDVGKVGVPPDLLLTHEPLSDAELAIYEAHAETGAQLLEQAEFPHKRAVINATRYHHTSFDGLGGRASIRGENIPLEARIVAVCDAFDVLISGRPRRLAMSADRALEDIFRRSGRDFDPTVVDALVEVVRQLPDDRHALMESLSREAEDIPYFASRRALRRAAKALSADGSSFD